LGLETRCEPNRDWVTPVGNYKETRMQVQQNKTSLWGSTDSHPSDKNKDVLPGPEGSPAPRWGTVSSFRGSAEPVDDYYVNRRAEMASN
jgi:hypothetical protein